MEIKKMVLDQPINILEAAQCILQLFEFTQLYDQGETDQDRIHLILAQMCMAYHSKSPVVSVSDPSAPHLPTVQLSDVCLRDIINYCKLHPTFNSKDAANWIRVKYGLRKDLSLFKLQDLGLFGQVIGLFYGNLLQTKAWSGEWIFDLHNDCIVVPKSIRKHLMVNHREQWGMYGTDLRSVDIIIGNPFKPKGTVFDIGVC